MFYNIERKEYRGHGYLIKFPNIGKCKENSLSADFQKCTFKNFFNLITFLPERKKDLKVLFGKICCVQIKIYTKPLFSPNKVQFTPITKSGSTL